MRKFDYEDRDFDGKDLKIDINTLMLFYDSSKELPSSYRIFKELNETVFTSKFSLCDVSKNREIKEKLNLEIPSIVVYSKGKFREVYNGEINHVSLLQNSINEFDRES